MEKLDSISLNETSPSGLLELKNTAVIFSDADHRIVYTNKTSTLWFGDYIPNQTLANDAWLTGQGLHLSDRRYRSISLKEIVDGNSEDPYVGLAMPKTTLWLQWQKIETHWQGIAVTALIFTNVSDLMLEIQSLQKRADHADSRDLITQLYNRRYALERMAQLNLHAQRYSNSFTVALVDIDHFKRLNDTFGHSFGDDVLRRIAKVIESSFRETDLCSRFGGEEFLILMPETEIKDAVLTLDRLRQLVSEMKWEQMQRPVTISSGVVTWQQNKSLEQLLFQADQRLTTAKKAGRNQVCGDLN